MSTSTDWRGVILRELVIRAGGTLAFADPSRSVREALAELSAEGVIAWDGTRATMAYSSLTALEPYPRSVVVVGMARVMRSLEDAPDHQLAESAISWDGELGTDASEVRTAAVNQLRRLGIVKRIDGVIRDVTGEVSRVSRKALPPFPPKPKPKAAPVKAVTPAPAPVVKEPTPQQAAPAPAPAPTAPTVPTPAPVPTAPAPAPTPAPAPAPVKQTAPAPTATPVEGTALLLSIDQGVRQLGQILTLPQASAREALSGANHLHRVLFRVMAVTQAKGAMNKRALSAGAFSKPEDRAHLPAALEYGVTTGSLTRTGVVHGATYVTADPTRVGVTWDELNDAAAKVKTRAKTPVTAGK